MPSNLEIIIPLSILGVAVIALMIVAYRQYKELKKLKHNYHLFMRGEEGKSLEKGLLRRMVQMEQMEKSIAGQHEELQLFKAVQDRSLVKYGIEKYDAFEDIGGRLSFALALLDKHDSGFVLNAIHSREDCFLYVKEIVNGESYIMLSDEEIKALRTARKYGEEEDIINEYQIGAETES